MDLIDWNDGFDRLIVRTEGPGRSAVPGGWSTSRPAMPTSSNMRVLNYPMPNADVGPTRLFRYKAGRRAGARRRADPAARPRGEGPAGGGAAARRADAHDDPAFDWWAQAFASRGYAVFQPNFRGSTNRGAGLPRAGCGNGAARCRPTSPTAWPRWPRGHRRSQARLHRRRQLRRLCGARRRDAAAGPLPLRGRRSAASATSRCMHAPIRESGRRAASAARYWRAGIGAAPT